MGKDDSTWLNLAYVFLFMAVSYAGSRAIDTLGVQLGWIERYDWFSTLDLIGGVLFGAVVVQWVRSSTERREYHLAAISELRKVTWPSFEDTKKNDDDRGHCCIYFCNYSLRLLISCGLRFFSSCLTRLSVMCESSPCSVEELL